MTPEQAVLYAIGICVAGAVLTLLVSKSKALAGTLAFLTMVATGILIVPAAFNVLKNGPADPHHPQTLWMAGGYAMRFYIDGLSAIFLLLAVVVAVLAALYSINHLKAYPNKSAAAYYPLLLLFVGGMYGIFATTDTMWFFFAFWQLMTLPSFLLVRFESEKPGIGMASIKYLVFMEAACAAAMMAASTLAGQGEAANASLKYDFDVLAEGIPNLVATHPQALTTALVLFLLAFGIKLGMWPFGQLWVPEAYAAAPSPVTALISGVMAKTGVYGLLRSFLWLVPAEAAEHYEMRKWGMALAVLGTITLFTGALQALKQDDAKRLLAFSSVSQLGYVLFSLGTCLALIGSGDPRLVALAEVAFFGSLLHALNHGLFKGLFFLNTGSLYQATGTQDLNKMGGLWKYMPLTGLTMLVVAFAMAGVPLLNGFVSKWSIYVAAIEAQPEAKYLPVLAIIAILTSAITLGYSMKLFGTAFLSRGSALVKEQAGARGGLEVGITQQIPQYLLALGCIVIGLFPREVYRILGQVLATSPQGISQKLAVADAASGAGVAKLVAVNGVAIWFPPIVLAVIVLFFVGAAVFSGMGGSSRRTADVWLCGYVREADCYRYAASNFYGEIKRCFGWLGGNARATMKEN